MFIDASALCAILLAEADGDAYAEKIRTAEAPITSPIAIYEAVAAVSRATDGDVGHVRREVEALLRLGRVRVVAIGDAESMRAIDAFDRFGKGRHPARLNMGDCFAYACAKTQGAPLLFKGDDFSQTDVAIA
ncbi:MAG: type II toxin-antitoxin system VapC family toxin [Caulobacterales bacterium]|nr:type II toxin-antitoxin system VapC family toxin [Caulobacterales bacterium]